MSDRAPAIEADRLRLSTRTGRVFPPLSFAIEPGTLNAVIGASGTGKTALLLTIAGRMRGWHGTGRVCGRDLARESAAVRDMVGVGLFAGVNDLGSALTVAQHASEARLFVPRGRRSACADVLERVGLSAMGGVRASQLDAEQRVRLGIALALVRDVRVLVVDEIDRDLNAGQKARVLGLLGELTGDGLAVVCACVDAASAEPAHTVIDIETAEVTVRGEEVESDAVA